MVVLGKITGAHGIKGWVRVFSYTEPREGILDYSPWLLGDQNEPVEVLDGARHGKTVIARLQGIESRDQAERLAEVQVAVERDRLPDPGHEQYYWADLIGLEVVNRGGEVLGTIQDMMATGAHDVMVVRGGAAPGKERLIPFVAGELVVEVDLKAGRVSVDWDRDF